MRKRFHLEKVFCFQIPGLRTGVSVYHGLLPRVLVVRDNKIHVFAFQRTTRNCSKVRFFFFSKSIPNENNEAEICEILIICEEYSRGWNFFQNTFLRIEDL